MFATRIRNAFGLVAAALLLWQSAPVVAEITAPPPPAVNARSYVLMDADSGRMLAGIKADARMEPASLPKIMTTYVISKELKSGHDKLPDMVTISARAWRKEASRSFVEVGK